MNIFAPDNKNESAEDNCARHYNFIRAWNEAYWGAILYARDLRKRGVSQVSADLVAWNEFDSETNNIPNCH